MTEAPNMWSEGNPKLQRAWDATSFRAMMFCPRYYELTVIEGWRGSTLDLEWGILYHGALDVGDKLLLDGKPMEVAQREAVKWAMLNSGQWMVEGANSKTGVWEKVYITDPPPEDFHAAFEPWSGRYRAQWRCTGTEPYKNEKGNRAKCPLSHKGNWQDTEAPGICGICGSEIERVDRWVPLNDAKDRYSLVRAVAWYYEDAPATADGRGVGLYAFPNGTPAVELPFRLPLPWKTPHGEDYLLAGYLDGIRTFGSEMFTGERKSTKKTLNQMYWAGYSPHIQVDIYDVAAAALFEDLPIKGVMVEAVQTLASGARYGRHIAYRTEAQREELMRDLREWLSIAERFAEQKYWPMNRANCWLCPLKSVCSKQPASRARELEQNFKRQHWNPLIER
jgi:hypothetical protein